MKNCAFQYATDNSEIIEDTDLITREEAEKLWEKHFPDFLSRIDDEYKCGAEMAIWINMRSGSDYHTTSKHYHTDDVLKDDKGFYIKEYLEV